MKFRHLKELVMAPEAGTIRQLSRTQGNSLPPPLGIIKVIHATSMGTSVSWCKGMLSVVSVENAECDTRPRKN